MKSNQVCAFENNLKQFKVVVFSATYFKTYILQLFINFLKLQLQAIVCARHYYPTDCFYRNQYPGRGSHSGHA